MAAAVIAVAQWVGAAVFAAIPTTVGLTTAATIAEVATAATLVAEVAAIAEVSSLLQPKVGGTYGTQVDFKADPQAGVPYVIGRTGTAGNIVFADTAGSKNIYLTYGVVLSGCGPIEAFESFQANDQVVDFSADGGEGASGFYLNRMWQVRQLGQTPEPSYLHFTATGSKDTPANHGGMPASWTSAHKLSGFAAYLWSLQYNTDKYGAGPPKPLSVIKGVKVYDPRKDSTYPGGSGPHRAGVESTYEYSDNAYLHALTWCIGRIQNGKHVMGVAADVAAIDTAAFVEGANVFEANGWSCGGVVYSTDDKYEVLKACLQAGAGKPMRLGAKISCLVNTPRTSLTTITGKDVVGKASIAGTITRRSRLNTIWPQYRDESQGWEMVTATQPVTVSAYYSPDRGMRSKTVEYSLVQDVDQAAQLARYDIEDSREFTPVVLPCKPRLLGYRPGDCITADEPEWGLNGQQLLILQRKVDPATFTITFTCRSETAAKHAFALGQTGVAPATPGLTGVDAAYVPTPDPDSWQVAETELTSADGTLPALVINGAVDAATVAAIIVDYREVIGDGTFGPWASQEFPPTATRLVIAGLKPNTAYQVRIRYRNVRQVEDPTGTDLGDHTTGGISATTIGTLTEDNISDAIALAEQTLADLNAAIAEADKTAMALATSALKQSQVVDALKVLGVTPDGIPLGPFAAEQKVRTDNVVQDVTYIGLRSEDGTAFDLSSTTLKIDGELLGDKLNVLAVATADLSAQIETEQTARIDGDTASTTAITSLSATVGTNQSYNLAQFSTLSSANSATSTELHLLGAKNAGGTAFVFDMTKAQTAPGVSFGTRLSGIDTAIGNNTSAISTETTNRISADSGITSTVSSLSTTVGGYSATISTQSAAISDLQGKTQAYMQIVAAAGSDPAYLKLMATSYGSAIMLAASELALYNTSSGALTRVLQLIGGAAYFGSPVSIDVGGKRLTIGPGFGASSDLVFWFGPDSTGLGSMTKTNGYWAFATDGKVYYGTGELGSGGAALGGSASPAGVSKSTLTAGTTYTNNVTVTPRNASGTVTYSWSIDNPAIGISNAGAATTQFYATVNSTTQPYGTAVCTITDASGASAQIIVAVRFFWTA